MTFITILAILLICVSIPTYLVIIAAAGGDPGAFQFFLWLIIGEIVSIVVLVWAVTKLMQRRRP